MSGAVRAQPRVFVDAIGLAAPGLAGWSASQSILRGEAGYESIEMPRYAPSLLPPNERRRATRIGRLAFQVAEEAIQHSSIPADQLAAVFASSGGDSEVMQRMCTALSHPERAMSPTDFHNSVHNAAAGYWSIATHARRPSTSLSAYDSSFAAGLMEAVSLVLQDAQPVLLVAYDITPQVPLHAARPLSCDFSCGLVLSAEPKAQAMALQLWPGEKGINETVMSDPGLEDMRRGNPAARALPLLSALAQARTVRLGLPYFDRCLAVDLHAC